MKTYSKDEAKEKTENLVAYFDDNKQNIVDETIIRRQFIDPLFTYLNWDIQNEKLSPLNERFIYEEERITIDGTQKRTDYTFCQGDGSINNRAFFLEAKSTKVNIEKDNQSAFQLRRYGWSAGLYISVLTNFEQLAIYNTKNIPPKSTDQSVKGRLEFLEYTDYVDNFDLLWDLLEFNNVQDGSIREYAVNKGIIADVYTKGEKTVDDAFLEQIEEWRYKLAKNIRQYKANGFIWDDKEKVNFAVQKIIDRIIFLRIIEDRGLETEGSLKQIAKNYQSLCEYFVFADKKYNSGLFHFSDEINRGIPDSITQKLYIVDNTINEIIESLYVNTPYAFSVMPAYILGSVYERFLGKEIDISGRKKKDLFEESVRIINKPDVRKAGGVYYTPEYIVDYIVQNTIPKKQDIKILDPACGSGSFLLVAYQYMLDIYQRKSPKKKLTLSERKQILLDHIYGVDIDEQAVEVTKLSLLLKVLEGVHREEIDHTGRKSEYALPSLHNNIKCGNSLIDDVGVAGEKAFVWAEEFPQVFDIFGTGGFDAVIGNPPYVGEKGNKEKFRPVKQNSLNKFYRGKMDYFYFFFHQGINLLKNKGTLGFITTNYYTTAYGASLLRNDFKERTELLHLINLGELKIFESAQGQHNMITILKKSNEKKQLCFTASTKRKRIANDSIMKQIFYKKDSETS